MPLHRAALCTRERWKPNLHGLPLSVPMMYFLIAWTETFPLTAITSILNDELHLTPGEISEYFAITFLPWMWKPVYGMISDSFPLAGYHRSPYVVIASLGSAFSYVAMALVTQSRLSMLGIAFMVSACSALLQLMVGGFLVDVARADIQNAVALQSLVNSSQWCGSLTAQILALATYAHGSSHAGSHLAHPQSALAVTAVAPFLVAALVPTLKEEPVTRMRFNRCRTLNLGWEDVKFGLTIACLQINLVLVGCRSLMQAALWIWLLGSTLLVSATIILLLYMLPCCKQVQQNLPALTQTSQLPATSKHGSWWWFRLCAYCFLVNALPKAGVVVGQFQYSTFNTETYQMLGIVSSCASLAGSLVFGGAFHRWRLKGMLAASTVVAAAAAVAPWPFVTVAIDHGVGNYPIWSTVGALCVAFTLCDGACSLFASLAVDTLVTAASGSVLVDRACTAYAALLACYSLGAVVSGLMAAPLVEFLGIRTGSWHKLPMWIIATALLRLLALGLLPLVPAPNINHRVGHGHMCPAELAGVDRNCEGSLG